jgi:hypothetical protein
VSGVNYSFSMGNSDCRRSNGQLYSCAGKNPVNVADCFECRVQLLFLRFLEKAECSPGESAPDENLRACGLDSPASTSIP